MDGNLMSAAIGDDNQIIGIGNYQNQIWTRPVSGTWTQLPGALTQVDTKGGKMVGIFDGDGYHNQYGGSIWKWVGRNGVNWERLAGAAVWVSVGPDGSARYRDSPHQTTHRYE
jgi:hypothetical protein